MIAWPLATDPDGADQDKWLDCDGRAVNSAIYPKLAAKMTHTPNYAGVFLRGVGNQYSSHYGSVLHQAETLGELQGDSIREISGTFLNNGNSDTYVGFRPGQGTGVFKAYNRLGGVGSNEGAKQDGGMYDFYASRVVPVSNEIRPINKSVRWLIRAA